MKFKPTGENKDPMTPYQWYKFARALWTELKISMKSKLNKYFN